MQMRVQYENGKIETESMVFGQVTSDDGLLPMRMVTHVASHKHPYKTPLSLQSMHSGYLTGKKYEIRVVQHVHLSMVIICEPCVPVPASCQTLSALHIQASQPANHH